MFHQKILGLWEKSPYIVCLLIQWNASMRIYLAEHHVPTPKRHSQKTVAICCWPSQKLNYPCGNMVPVDWYSADSLMNCFILLNEVTKCHAWQIHSSLNLSPLYILLISWIFQLCRSEELWTVMKPVRLLHYKSYLMEQNISAFLSSSFLIRTVQF